MINISRDIAPEEDSGAHRSAPVFSEPFQSHSPDYGGERHGLLWPRAADHSVNRLGEPAPKTLAFDGTW